MTYSDTDKSYSFREQLEAWGIYPTPHSSEPSSLSELNALTQDIPPTATDPFDNEWEGLHTNPWDNPSSPEYKPSF